MPALLSALLEKLASTAVVRAAKRGALIFVIRCTQRELHDQLNALPYVAGSLFGQVSNLVYSNRDRLVALETRYAALKRYPQTNRKTCQ